MENLVGDCLALVLAHLPPKDRFRLSRVAKEWRRAALSSISGERFQLSDFVRYGTYQAPPDLFTKHIRDACRHLDLNAHWASVGQYLLSFLSAPLLQTVTVADDTLSLYHNGNADKLAEIFRTITPTVHSLSGFVLLPNPSGEVIAAIASLSRLEHLGLKFADGEDCPKLLSKMAHLTSLECANPAFAESSDFYSNPVLLSCFARYQGSQFTSLHSLSLRVVISGAQDVMSMLACLPNLRHLTLAYATNSRFDTGELDVLAMDHPRLERLVISPHFAEKFVIGGACLKFLHVGALSFGNSRDLDLYTPELEELEMLSGSVLIVRYEGRMEHFPPKLRRALIETTGFMMTDGPLVQIGSSSPCLKEITVRNCSIFSHVTLESMNCVENITIVNSDDLGAVILETETLQSLKRLDLTNSKKLQNIIADFEGGSLPNLHYLSVSLCSRLELDNLVDLVAISPNLVEIVATNLPKSLLTRLSERVGERAKNIKIIGNLMSDMVWRAKYQVFNKGGAPADPGMYTGYPTLRRYTHARF